MINLLPPSEKENLKKEERLKLAIILELSVLFFLISFSLIFLSIDIYVGSFYESQQIALSGEKEKLDEIKEFKKELDETNRQLEELDYFYSQQTDLSGFLGEIKSLFPGGISLEKVSINAVDGAQKLAVSASGNASLIENLTELRTNLKEDGSFDQISFLPTSIWVESEDIDFTINFQAILKK